MQKNQDIVFKKAPPPGTLGKAELYSVALGYVVGAGIVSLIGPALIMTGHSAWFAYFVAIFFGLLANLPAILVASTLRLGGGPYSLLAGLGGKAIAGVYAVSFLAQTCNMGIFGLSLGLYANALWPVLNPKIIGILGITFFYVINLFGVDLMAKVQKIMTWLLLGAFMLFFIMGLFKINQPVFNFTAPTFFRNGAEGFIAAIFLYVASTNGYLMSMAYGRDAKNATRDIPWAMLMCVPTFIILYCGVTISGSGVLPLEVVEGQTLTTSAQHIFPPWLFVLFMITGPMQALTSTMNSAFANNSIPIAQSSLDGWFPKSFAAKNRFGSHWKIMTLLYLIGIVPLIAGLDLTALIMVINIILAIMSFLYTIAYWRMPKRYPASWKKSRFHMPDKLYYAVVIIAFLCWMAIFAHSVKSLSLPVVITLIVIFAVSIGYGIIRSKKGNISIEVSIWPLDEREQEGPVDSP